MAEQLLIVRGVRKSFGGLQVLCDVDLAVEQGSITGLIGPNGSGKSTLFDIITGYLPCDAGEVAFNGEPVAGLPPHQIARRGMIRTFQLTKIFSSLTVAENLLVFAPRRRRGGRDHGEEKACELLEFVGLRNLAEQEAAALSYGQQKLLEIAQVLMLGPSLLMLDEPMAGINPGLAEEIVQRLRDLREAGMTLLIIEHNIPVLLSICDRMTVLNGGEVMASGEPESVLGDHEVREAFLGA